MTDYVITSPEGKKYKVSGQGTKEEALAQLKSKLQGQPQAQPEQAQESQQYLSLPDQFKRMLGRTARIGAEAVGAMPLMAMDAGVAGRNLITGSSYKLPSQQYREALDAANLPRPEGAIETGVDIVGQVVAGSKTIPNIGIANQAPKAAQLSNVSAKEVGKSIAEAVPSKKVLKEGASKIYKELDEMSVVLDSKAYNGLLTKVSTEMEKMGVDKDITPKAAKALARFLELSETNPKLTDINKLRTIAGNAANTIDGPDKALGSRMVSIVDDFLDDLSPAALKNAGSKEAGEISGKYKSARDLWGRARKSELIETALDKASRQASGLENGIRIQIGSILNNPKKVKFFSPDEKAAMEKVVKGTTSANAARMLGKFGFSEGRATQMIGGMMGVGAGATVGGPVGAMLVPAIGQVSKKLAQRLTENNAKFADQVIRAGKNAKQITESYLRNTPKSERSVDELTELLIRKNVDYSSLPIPKVKANNFKELSKYIASVISTQRDKL